MEINIANIIRNEYRHMGIMMEMHSYQPILINYAIEFYELWKNDVTLEDMVMVSSKGMSDEIKFLADRVSLEFQSVCQPILTQGLKILNIVAPLKSDGEWFSICMSTTLFKMNSGITFMATERWPGQGRLFISDSGEVLLTPLKNIYNQDKIKENIKKLFTSITYSRNEKIALKLVLYTLNEIAILTKGYTICNSHDLFPYIW
jgi:hypothetical protein